MSVDLEEKLKTSEACSESNPEKARILLLEVLNSALSDELAVLVKERAIYALTKVYCFIGAKDELINMVQREPVSVFLASISKAKVGKIVRSVVREARECLVSDEATAIEMCQSLVQWCKSENRKFLRLEMETALSELYLSTAQLQAALETVTGLVRSVKKVEDKHVLVKVHLIESRIQHALHNIPKAKAALTAARAAANSIYVGPQVQAQMDMQSGRIAVEECDYKTSFSYFYEAFEGYDTLIRGDKPDSRARLALKYMLLSKIMYDLSAEVEGVCLHKLAVKYAADLEMECMKAVAKAYSARSLSEFESVIHSERFREVIHGDPLVSSKLGELSDKLTEQNLSKLIEPFSRVEVAHIAAMIELDVGLVSRKLSQMILDGKFDGILDQGSGAIIVFEAEQSEKSYEYALESVETLSHTVDKLFDKAKLLD